MNTLEYATIFQQELDKAAIEQATSGWMEINDKLVKYSGGKEVKIPEMDMDGLADYDRSTGFVDGSIDLKYQTKELTQDRGRRFIFDENEVDETNFIVTASSVMGEFQRLKVIPELDAYRYSTIASTGISENRASGGYVPDEDTILKKLYYDIAQVQDVIGEDTPLVITMSSLVAAIFDMSTSLTKHISPMDFKQGDLSFKVTGLNGQHPIRRAGSARMKTKYVFKDGKSTDQEKGGFVAAADAKDINWMITPAASPIAVSKTDKMRIFDPETYQNSRSWVCDYRKFHDLWVTKQQIKRCWINIKQDL